MPGYNSLWGVAMSNNGDCRYLIDCLHRSFDRDGIYRLDRSFASRDLSSIIPLSSLLLQIFSYRFRASACGACGAHVTSYQYQPHGCPTPTLTQPETQRETHTLLSRQASLSLVLGWIPGHVSSFSCSVVSIRLCPETKNEWRGLLPCTSCPRSYAAFPTAQHIAKIRKETFKTHTIRNTFADRGIYLVQSSKVLDPLVKA